MAQQDIFAERIKKCCRENIYDVTLPLKLDNEEITMRVTLDKSDYGEFLYWRVILDKIPKNTMENPFKRCDSEYINEKEIGEVVADNKLMRTLFEFLVMPDELLQKYSGNNAPIEYRSAIIAAIMNFWD